VYLFSQNLYTNRLSCKLNFKKLRLFTIRRKVTTFNYKLNLLTFIKVLTKVLYISLFKLILKTVLLKEEI
ncbi:hypothetical protein QBC34DRAFT_305355, partial [Podospora aff. communis PSN243]